ncbi:MAG: SGNH/GDSL hydrolase family protein [Planctomycetes bacterium]|nr:SGNH/GDSL hydrolase family protein [Planctomycetota bacterium]
MLRRSLFRLLLALASASATLAAVELSLRALRGAPERAEFRFERFGGSRLAVEDEGRYLHHPRRFFTLAAPFRDAFRPGRYALGAWAFRGRPLEPAPPGLLRVGLFGDSCVYGAAVDTADMLGQQLAEALEERGLPPTQVLVASFGVPGYSTVQIRALLEEVLAAQRLDAVVIYAAAWNDQSPAMGTNDVALRTRTLLPPHPLEGSATFAFLRELSAHAPQLTQKEILSGWRAAKPPYGTRVPAPDVERELRAMIAVARGAGAELLCIAPAHPPKTRLDHPRVLEDAETVRRVAHAEQAALLDAAELFRTARTSEESLFCDFVHPSPLGTRLLGKAIGEALAPALLALRRSRPAVPELDYELARLVPETCSRVGGERLELELRGGPPLSAAPLLLVGGAPLFDVELASDGRRLRATLPEQRAGTYDLLLQSAAGCTRFRAALSISAERLELEPGPLWKLRFHARAGDLAIVRVATQRLLFPEWTERGAQWLDPRTVLPDLLPIQAGPNGIGELEFPPPAEAAEPQHFLQAEIVARAPDGSILSSRWSTVLEVRRPTPR